jgi:hypothetical protein
MSAFNRDLDAADSALVSFGRDDRRVPTFDGAATIGVVCRVCWAHVRISRERVELVEGRVYVCCPECTGSFLIRWDDAVALGIAESSPSMKSQGGSAS